MVVANQAAAARTKRAAFVLVNARSYLLLMSESMMGQFFQLVPTARPVTVAPAETTLTKMLHNLTGFRID